MISARSRHSGILLGLWLLLLPACKDRGGPTGPTDSPVIQIDVLAFSHQAREGDMDPDPFVVQIVNGGEGQLTNLSAQAEYDDSTAPDWLTVELLGSSAPAELRVRVNLAELQVGQHTARVRISSPNATAEAVTTVSLDLLPPRSADLRFVGEIVVVDTVLKAGEPIELRDIRIDNVGDLPAEFEVWWWRADELGVISFPEDRPLRKGNRLSLDPGASLTLEGSAVLASRGPLGRQYLALFIMPFGSNEYHGERDSRWFPYVVEGLSVDVAVQGEGSMSVTPEADAYEYREEVSIAAEPSPGWIFDRWEPGTGDEGASRDNPLLLTLEQDAAYTAVFVEDPRPDLRFGAAPTLSSDRTKIAPGMRVRLESFEVWNAGGTAASARMGLYLSHDAVIDEADLLLGDREVILQPGWAEVFLAESITLPRDLDQGEWFLGVVLDRENDVEEWDESNNQVILPFTVEGFRVEVVIEGAGQVRADPGLEGLPWFERVSFTAIPDEGWAFREWRSTFSGWSDDNPLVEFVDEDFQLTATFVPLVAGPSLTAQLSDGGRLDLTWSFDWPCTRGRVCTPSTDDEYELQVEDLSGSAGFQPLLRTSETRDSPYTHSYRPPAGSYRFRVRALGADFQSEWSEAVTVIVP